MAAWLTCNVRQSNLRPHLRIHLMSSSNLQSQFGASLRRALSVFLPLYLAMMVLFDLARHKASWSSAYLFDRAIACVIVAVVYAVVTWWLGRAKSAPNTADDKNA